MIIEKTCIVCPIGCHLKIEEDSSSKFGYRVRGNKCPRGEKYGIKEMTRPERMVTSTVRIKHMKNHMLPVKTSQAIDKDKVFQLMEDISRLEVSLPIKRGDILIKNIYASGVDLVAAKTIN